jgi:hypothetical protein
MKWISNDGVSYVLHGSTTFVLVNEHVSMEIHEKWYVCGTKLNIKLL